MISEWNVMLQPADRPRHCLAFGYDPATSVWVVVDPHRHGTDVELLRPARFDAWIAKAAPLAEVYRIDAQHRTPTLFPGFWCVGAVKRLVGLKSGALSLRGLRRDLLRAGARRVFQS